MTLKVHHYTKRDQAASDASVASCPPATIFNSFGWQRVLQALNLASHFLLAVQIQGKDPVTIVGVHPAPTLPRGSTSPSPSREPPRGNLEVREFFYSFGWQRVLQALNLASHFLLAEQTQGKKPATRVGVLPLAQRRLFGNKLTSGIPDLPRAAT